MRHSKGTSRRETSGATSAIGNSEDRAMLSLIADLQKEQRLKSATDHMRLTSRRLQNVMHGNPEFPWSSAAGRRFADAPPKFIGTKALELSKAVNADYIQRFKEERSISEPSIRRLVKLDDDISMDMMTRSQTTLVEGMPPEMVKTAIDFDMSFVREPEPQHSIFSMSSETPTGSSPHGEVDVSMTNAPAESGYYRFDPEKFEQRMSRSKGAPLDELVHQWDSWLASNLHRLRSPELRGRVVDGRQRRPPPALADRPLSLRRSAGELQ